MCKIPLYKKKKLKTREDTPTQGLRHWQLENAMKMRQGKDEFIVLVKSLRWGCHFTWDTILSGMSFNLECHYTLD